MFEQGNGNRPRTDVTVIVAARAISDYPAGSKASDFLEALEALQDP